MFPYFRHAAHTVCVLALLACSDERGPTAPASDSTESMLPAPVSLSTMAPSSEELASMPVAFQSASTILNTDTFTGFAYNDGAYSQAYMEYYATNAEQDAFLSLRYDGREIARKMTTGRRSDFLPATRTLWTNVTIPTSAQCGHAADGWSQHRAFHSFIVSGWKFLSWGHAEDPSSDNAEQEACPESPRAPDGRNGAGSGDEYESDCYSCQQWFWYDYGQIVDEWWECTPIDSYLCTGNLAT